MATLNLANWEHQERSEGTTFTLVGTARRCKQPSCEFNACYVTNYLANASPSPILRIYSYYSSSYYSFIQASVSMFCVFVNKTFFNEFSITGSKICIKTGRWKPSCCLSNSQRQCVNAMSGQIDPRL